MKVRGSGNLKWYMERDGLIRFLFDVTMLDYRDEALDCPMFMKLASEYNNRIANHTI